MQCLHQKIALSTKNDQLFYPKTKEKVTVAIPNFNCWEKFIQSFYMHFQIFDNAPEVKAVKKWNAEKETDDIIVSCIYYDIVGTEQKDQKQMGHNLFKPFLKRI